MQNLRDAAIFVFFIIVAPGITIAQTPGADEASNDVAIAQDLTTALVAGKWQLNGSFGMQWQGGRSESLGYNVNLIVAHATKRFALLRWDAELNRSEYRQEIGQKRIVSDDNRTAMFTVLPRMKSSVKPIVITTWRQDRPARLKHRTTLQAGPYARLFTGPRFSLSGALLAGTGLQDNAERGASHHVPTYGAMQSVSLKLAHSTSLTVYAAEHRNMNDGRDYAVMVSSSMNVTVARPISVYFYHRIGYEGIVPVGIEHAQQSAGAGLQLSVF